jgi:signal transduction histidine kinase
LENAVKFTVVPPVVTITSEVVSESAFGARRGITDYHKISVKDNGIGFPDKYKDQIFEVFKRLHSQSEFKGTGIGLAICKRVVTNHKGFISVSSEVGKGSTFSIYLPLVLQDEIEPALIAQN